MNTLLPQEHTVTFRVSLEGLKTCRTDKVNGSITWHREEEPHWYGGTCAFNRSFAEKNMVS